MAFFTQCSVLQILVSPSGILCSVFFFSLWEISLLVLSKRIEGFRMEEQEDRWKEWHRWPEETNQEVWHIVGGGGSGGVWGGWGCWVRIESQVKTEEMMRLMTVVNTFSLYVTSEVKTAKSMLSKLCFFADDTDSYITEENIQEARKKDITAET